MKLIQAVITESIQATAEELVYVLEFLGSQLVRNRITEDVPTGFDLDGCVRDTIELYRHERKGDAEAEAATHYSNVLWNLANRTKTDTEQIEKLLQAMEDSGGAPIPPHIENLIATVQQLDKEIKNLVIYRDKMTKITLQLDNIMRAAHNMQVYNREMNDAQVKVAQAYLKMHRIPMKKPHD